MLTMLSSVCKIKKCSKYSICFAQPTVKADDLALCSIWFALCTHCAYASSLLYLSNEFKLRHKCISWSEFAGSKRFLDGVLICKRRFKPSFTRAFSALNVSCSNLDNLGQSVWCLAATVVSHSERASYQLIDNYSVLYFWSFAILPWRFLQDWHHFKMCPVNWWICQNNQMHISLHLLQLKKDLETIVLKWPQWQFVFTHFKYCLVFHR